MAPEWPLVGRREELALMEEALDRPEVRGAVLSGEAGVGKSRLAREALRTAESRGFATAWASGTHSASLIPFGALAYLLPEEILPADRAAGRGGTKNLLRAAGEALVEAAEDGHLVVVGVDDAHLLDGSSAALLHHLAVSGTAFVLAAVRSGEPAPDAVAALWKEGLAERMEVQPLSRDETEGLLESALGGQVEGATVHLLFETTRGNPLFLREVVLGGVQAGSLVETEGVWRWTGSLEPSSRLLDVVEERLGRVDDAEREILEIVAEAEYVGAGVLRRLAEWEAVEELERRGLLESWLDGRRTRVRLAHPLYAEAIRARTPPLRANAIRSGLADAVQEWGARRRQDLLRVATWRLKAGDPLSPGLAVPASRRAAQAFDHELAERLGRAALELGGSFEATHALVEALIGQGRFAEADDLLQELEAEPQPEGARAMSAIARATNLFWRMGKGREAWEVLRRAEAAVSDPALRDEVAATRATFLVFGGRMRDGIELGLDVAERATSERAVVQTVPTAWGLNVSARMERAVEFVERVRGPVEKLAGEFPLGPAWLHVNENLARFLEGSLEDAVAGLEAHYMRATEEGSWERAIMPWALAWIERVRGRVRTARRWVAEAVAVFREVDMLNHLPLCLAQAAHVEALLGEPDRAAAALDEAERLRLPLLRAGEGFFGLARTWVAAARGEVSAAIEESLRTAEATGEIGEVVFQAAALHDAARLGAASGVADELERVAERTDGRLIPGYAAHARALARSDASALTEVSAAFEEMGAMLYAAEAAAEAARIHRDEGHTGSALAGSAQAARLAQACEGARTPALEDVDAPLTLTPREREVATLAAGGASNQEIAERLVISVRTVENHLHAAYTKLGVTGRHDLASILSPQRPGEAPTKI